MLPYMTGALSLMGSVIRPLPLLRTTLVMFAQSFLNRFTPMNAGGMAMRVRYLQKGGTDVAVAAAAVGLTSAASGVAQGVLIVLFALWAGTSPGGTFSLPEIDHWPLIILVLAGIVAAFVFVPSLRGLAVRWLKPLKEKLVHEAGQLLHRPDKLGLLFGGAFLGKFLNILAWVVSCRALGITLGFPELGALYMFGNTVGSAVPTPGGVGGIDARAHRGPDQRRGRRARPQPRQRWSSGWPPSGCRSCPDGSACPGPQARSRLREGLFRSPPVF